MVSMGSLQHWNILLASDGRSKRTRKGVVAVTAFRWSYLGSKWIQRSCKEQNRPLRWRGWSFLGVPSKSEDGDFTCQFVLQRSHIFHTGSLVAEKPTSRWSSRVWFLHVHFQVNSSTRSSTSHSLFRVPLRNKSLDIWETGTVQEAGFGPVRGAHDVSVWRHWGEAAPASWGKTLLWPTWVFWYTWYGLFHFRAISWSILWHLLGIIQRAQFMHVIYRKTHLSQTCNTVRASECSLPTSRS